HEQVHPTVLASDLRSAGRPVVADLSADRLTTVLAGGLTVVKVSDDELLADGRVTGTSQEELIDALHRMHAEGAANVIITRAEDPVLVLANGAVREVRMPKMQVVDTHGAGDSLTAGVAATLARDGSMEDAVQVGVAAGALNVTHHGLGTGQAEALLKLRRLVTTHTIESERSRRVTPRELADRANEE
ncbi:MAG: PfkB family carbohydrate kinase, partial [Jiangellaceae bacterium]